MAIKDVNNAIGVTFLIVPALLWAIWSFQLYDLFQVKKFEKTTNDNRGLQNQEDSKDFFEHETSGILGSSVCPFGKAGAVFIIIWSILLVFLLFTVNILYWDEKNANKLRIALQAIGWTNVAIMIIVGVLSLVMNPALFFRTLPFYFLQTGIGILILNNIPPKPEN